MRIHTNTVDGSDIYAAALHANARVFKLDDHGSRTHTVAFEVNLSGNSPRRTQNDRDRYAATYEQWGIFLARLYTIDPDIKAGPYKNAVDFKAQTHGAF